MLADKPTLIAKPAKIRKHILDAAGREVAVLAFEHQQRGTLPQNPFRALQHSEFGAFDIDLEQCDIGVFAEIIVERDQRHRQGREGLRPQRGLTKRRAGLMAGREKQILFARMRIDRLGFDLHIAKLDRPAHVGQTAGQFRLRLERDHAATPDPARQPIDEATLVGADVADDVARPDVAADHVKLGLLVAKPRLQRANPKPDAFGGKPGLQNGRRAIHHPGHR